MRYPGLVVFRLSKEPIHPALHNTASFGLSRGWLLFTGHRWNPSSTNTCQFSMRAKLAQSQAFFQTRNRIHGQNPRTVISRSTVSVKSLVLSITASRDRDVCPCAASPYPSIRAHFNRMHFLLLSKFEAFLGVTCIPIIVNDVQHTLHKCPACSRGTEVRRSDGTTTYHSRFKTYGAFTTHRWSHCARRAEFHQIMFVKRCDGEHANALDELIRGLVQEE